MFLIEQYKGWSIFLNNQDYLNAIKNNTILKCKYKKMKKLKELIDQKEK